MTDSAMTPSPSDTTATSQFRGLRRLFHRRAQPQAAAGAASHRRPSLARRLTLAGTLLLTVTASTVAVLGFRTTSAFLTARYREHLRVLAEYAAMHTELGLLLKDADMVRSAVAALLDRADVQGITVLDEEGRCVYAHMREPVPKGDPPHWVEVPVWTREIRDALPGLDADAAPRRIGTVRLGYSLGVLNDLRRQLVMRFALFTAGLILLSALVYGGIARSLTRPLRRLEATAQDVARGRLDVRAPKSGLRETDQVAHMFNAMLDALVQREKDLEQLNARLARREALAEVGRFSSMVAHEIKNPLTILRGSLQVLQRPDPAGTAHATALRFMEEEVRRIDRLVSDFLLFAKPITAEKRRSDWVQWLKTAAEKMRLMAEGGERLRLELGQDHEVPGRFDGALMETTLGHLVRNALEATPKGGTVRVLSWVDSGGDEGVTGMWWCFAVEDDGPGVPEEHREKIFEPFFTTKAKGSGLGLAMVRRIVEAHGGTVAWMPGAEGRGSRFVVRVPSALEP